MSPDVSIPSPLLSQRNETGRLEAVLAASELRYGKDVTRLQQALLRARRLHYLSLVSLQLRLVPIVRTAQRLAIRCGFYKWKGNISVNISYRYKRAMATIRHMGKKKMMRALITFRERGVRAAFIHRIERPAFNNGAVASINLPDSDSEQ